MAKILLTRSWPASVEDYLRKHYETTFLDRALSVAQWREALQEYDAVCPCVADKLSAEVFKGLVPKTKLIANYGVGYNHIDIEAAAACGLMVTNTPGVLTDATADLAMTLMLMLSRRAGEGERQLRAGEWHGWYPTHLMGTQVTGATLAVIGMGRIGLALAKKAHFGFGMKILYHNRHEVAPHELGGLPAQFFPELSEMLPLADIISLHCPGRPETKHLMNAERFAAMRSNAFLINTARGDVVDEDALVNALANGEIGGAGLDVFEGEPKVHPGLLQREDVVLLPHLGSATLTTRTAMGMRVVANLDAYFAGQVVPDQVV